MRTLTHLLWCHPGSCMTAASRNKEEQGHFVKCLFQFEGRQNVYTSLTYHSHWGEISYNKQLSSSLHKGSMLSQGFSVLTTDFDTKTHNKKHLRANTGFKPPGNDIQPAQTRVSPGTYALENSGLPKPIIFSQNSSVSSKCRAA